jgi:NAD(P)-dependent dehydrogenase (short-subunit alcohol dehydrogenase family)
LETTGYQVRAEGAEALLIRADLRLPSEIDRALYEVKDNWGLPDILVNNAAVLHRRPFEDTDGSIWDETLQVNLEATYYLTWRLYPHLVKQGRGNILTMSSNAGIRPSVRETAYCASKYALEGLFRALALEATDRGLIITLCSPGRTTKPTSMTEASFTALPDEQRARYADPEVFAEAFGYLAETSDPVLSGRRFDLFALAELVREHGWTLPSWLALQRAERNHA